MKLKLTWLLTLFMAFVMQFSFAQEKTVTGTVTTAADGLPLPGASVIVKGTARGQQTDFDGKYSIKVNTGEVLVISYVGMTASEVTVGAGNVYDVALEEGNALDEVVVVGYSKTTKESFTGTAAVVDMDGVDDKVVSNVTQALRGEVAGVNVITRSGQPGASAEVRIRGFGSINGNTLPLYIVDGAPLTGTNVLQSLNPSDVESMVVLKDAAATSIYGSRGANGVILITTKKGKAGVSRISVDVTTSVNTLFLPEYDVITSPEEYMEIEWQALRNKGILTGEADPAAFASNNLYGTAEGINELYNIWDAPGSQLINNATGKFNPGVQRRFTPTLWRDAAFDTGLRTEANLQFSGGNEKTKFAASLGYVNDDGYSINSNYRRYTTRINLEHKAKDWLTIGGNIAWTGARNTNSGNAGSAGSSANPFALVYTTPAIYDVYLRDLQGNLVADPIFGGSQFDFGDVTGRRAWNATNGIALATLDLDQTDITTLLGNFNVGIDITDWLSFETRYSGQFDQRNRANRNNPYYGGAATSGGSLFLTDDTSTNQNFLQLLRFQKSFGDDHDLEVFVAHESTENRFRRFNAAAQRAILPNTIDLDQYTTPFGRAQSFRQGWTLDSYFSGLNYDYADKYFLTASVRRDGSSRFIQDKWGTFGSVGLGWIVTKEDFMSNVGALDFLKVKASYGIIGDVGTGLQNGFQLFSINQTPTGAYSFTRSSTLANTELTWETSNILQFGFESTWLDGRLNVDVDYYDKRTTDLFFDENLPPSSSFQTIRYNGGELKNSGLEFNINAKLIEKENFRLGVNLNGETFTNEVTEMPVSITTGDRPIFDNNQNLAKGQSQWDWYMREWAGVNPANGEALWYQYYVDANDNGIFDTGELSTGEGFPIDVDNDGINDNQSGTLFEYRKLSGGDSSIRRTTTNNYADATQVFTGKSAIPDVRGGFRLNAGFKNFDISAQFSYSIGGHVYDSGYRTLMQNDLIGANNYHTDIRDAWSGPGDIAEVPRTSANFGTDNQQDSFSSRFLTKADYFALNNVNLNYRLPQKTVESMGLNSVSLFLSGDNLMMLSRRDGLNPATAIGTTNSGIYMPLTTFSLGAKIEF